MWHALKTNLAGLYVAHLIASPREHPVKREKLRTQVSRVTTLKVTGIGKLGISGETKKKRRI
jgi:hypothetical protein